MRAATYQIAAVLLMIAPVAFAGDDIVGDTVSKLRAELQRQCKCATFETCQGYVDCIEETSCPQIFVDHKQALKSVKCEQKKFEAIDCGVLVHLHALAIYNLPKEYSLPDEYSCLAGASRGDWTCADFRRNNQCLKHSINTIFYGKCDVIYDVIEEGLCSGKSIAESISSKNIARFVNKKFGF